MIELKQILSSKEPDRDVSVWVRPEDIRWIRKIDRGISQVSVSSFSKTFNVRNSADSILKKL